MNYGKSNLQRRKKKVSSKRRMKKKRVGVRIFKSLIICILLLGVIGIVGAGVIVKKVIDDTPEVTAEDILPQGYTTSIVNQEGTVLEQLKDSDSNRVYKKYDEISKYMGDAFVAIEDERFYQHNGIDIQGIIRAGVNGVMNGFHFNEGASTITQQLIKNNVFPNFIHETKYERIERKIQEQYLALKIEKQLSKKEILEAYMNTINLGQGCLGVQTASKRYFNKDAADLTLSECTVIAAITQNPTGYDPVNHPEDNAKRREKVLKNMKKHEFISEAEYEEAMADNVYDRILETASNTETSKPYTYFVDALIQQIVKDLVNQKSYTETQAYNLIYSGGLTITATQDADIQQICDEEVDNVDDYLYGSEWGLDYALTVHHKDGTSDNYSKEQLASYIQNKTGDKYPLVFSTKDLAQNAIDEYKSTLNIDEEAGDTVDERIDLTPQPQTSIVVMDQYTGQVKAIVGGRGEKTSSLSLNRATDSARQPGSCFKILAAYAPALDENKITLATTIDDEYYEYKNGQEVGNWDNKHIGATRVRYGIEHSMNVLAVKTLTEYVGETESYDYLTENFAFTTLTDDDKTSQAKALGGITNGVYNIEMTAAYAAIANGGTYTEPILYTQVLDHNGDVLLDNTQPKTHQAIKDSTAYLLTSAMEDVVNGSGGTGHSAALDNMPVAAKTGTSQESNDLWISAFTPYYTASVWGGYDEQKTMANLSQNWHQKLWKNIMERIQEDKGLEYKDFEIPSSVEEKTICTRTGLLATSSCPTLTEYFATDNAPTQSCSGHYVAPSYSYDDDDSEKKDDKKKEDSSDGTNSDGSSTDTSGDGSASEGSGDGSSTGDAGSDGSTDNGGATEGGGEEAQ